MNEEQLKKLGIGTEQPESPLREILRKGTVDEMVVFGLASYLKYMIETVAEDSDGADKFPPTLVFEVPSKGVKVVVSIEKMGE